MNTHSNLAWIRGTSLVAITALALGCNGGDKDDGGDTDSGTNNDTEDTGFDTSGGGVDGEADLYYFTYEFVVDENGKIAPITVNGQSFDSQIHTYFLYGDLELDGNNVVLGGDGIELVCVGNIPLVEGDGYLPTEAADDSDSDSDSDSDAGEDTDTSLSIGDWLAANDMAFGLGIGDVSGRTVTYETNDGDCEVDDGNFVGSEFNLTSPHEIASGWLYGMPVDLESSGNANDPGPYEQLISYLVQTESVTEQQAATIADTYFDGIAEEDEAGGGVENNGWFSGYELDDNGDVKIETDGQGNNSLVPLERPFVDSEGNFKPGYYSVEPLGIYIAPEWQP